jgi:ornithine carbamoyltransferase
LQRRLKEGFTMPVNLNGRSLLSVDDLSAAEFQHLMELAAELKAEKRAGNEQRRLLGRNIALIFEKDSTRTRTGFEVAAYDQGANVTYLGPDGSHFGHKESIKDTARVLGRMYDAIEFRGYSQKSARDLAAFSGVPVYNGLTDEAHPTQTLADMMTMREFAPEDLSTTTLAFSGDIGNNVARSLALGAVKLGMDMRLVGPEELRPEASFLDHLQEVARQSDGRITVTADPISGLAGADFVYTDVWLSMGESEERWAERIELLTPFRVSAALMALTGNAHARFMHCLPAFHNAETEVGAEIARRFGITSMEVTEEVFEGPSSIVFDQAENRMHTIKAVLVATLGA